MVNDFRRYFELPTNIVAVKFSDEELKETEGGYRYCEAVRLVSKNSVRIILNKRNISCHNALSTLKLLPSPLGSEKVFKSIIIEPYKGQECDVILIVTNPERIMRIANAYFQIFKKELVARFSGESAVCGEATMDVYESGEPNVTFLCNGARRYGGYKNDEVVIGIPYKIFKKFEREISRLVVKSMCGCLMDDLPKYVVERFEKLGFDKATDHFIGIFNGKIIKIYVLKGEKIYGIAVILSIKFKDERTAEKVISKYDGNFILNRRENWIDISKVLEFENFEEYVLKKEFEEKLDEEIKSLILESKKIKALAE